MVQKEIVYLTRKEMEEDLIDHDKNPILLNDEELEIYYNNEFYIGFEGKEYQIKKGKK